MPATDKHLIISARENAQRAALSLFSVASAIYPGDNPNLVNHFVKEAIEAGLALGLHARKVLELCHLEDMQISSNRWQYEEDIKIKERSFKQATNRFVHAKTLKIRTLSAPWAIFGQDIVLTEFLITTDKREEASIDIFAFAWTYLSGIAPQITE